MTTAESEYKIQIMYGNGKHMLAVKGKPVTVPGFEHHRFFLHRPVYDISKDEHGNVVPAYSGGWAITEATTGKNLGRSASTKAEAIEHAKIVLEKHKVEFEQELRKEKPNEPWRHQTEEQLIARAREGSLSGHSTISWDHETKKTFNRLIRQGKIVKQEQAMYSGAGNRYRYLAPGYVYGAGGKGMPEEEYRAKLAEAAAPTHAYAATHAETTKRIGKPHESRGGDQNAAIHAWYDDTEEERKAHDRGRTPKAPKPRFSINRKSRGAGRGRDLGADIVRDRRGRHLRL